MERPADTDVPEGFRLRSIAAGVLDIGYLEAGPETSLPVVMAHGFPYSPFSYVEAAASLAREGLRCILPYQRGFGPTRFPSLETPRSGEQAALTGDLLALLDALKLDRPILAGFDWGGRAACGVAAVAPDRLGGLVTVGGYNVFGPPPANDQPATADWAHRTWYQHFFHHERARVTLEQGAAAFCRYIWPLWSPDWVFDDATYARSAAAFGNPDFAAVVLHSYRHRARRVPGDPALAVLAAQLERQPDITVPTMVLHGGSCTIQPASLSEDLSRFTGRVERRTIAGIGHNLPQEAPAFFAEAVATVAGWLARP